MPAVSLKLNPQLSSASRFHWFTTRAESTRLIDWTTLLCAGVTAGLASGLLDFSLKIPGHAILRIIFPMTLGLVLVPRRGAGSVMTLSPFWTGLLLRGTGVVAGMSIGAFTSLLEHFRVSCVREERHSSGKRLYSTRQNAYILSENTIVNGPLLDLTLRNTKKPYWIYFNCALAGLFSHRLALAVRGCSKWSGWERVGKAPVEVWRAWAALTYPLCGSIAGLVCAVLWFSIRPKDVKNSQGDA